MDHLAEVAVGLYWLALRQDAFSMRGYLSYTVNMNDDADDRGLIRRIEALNYRSLRYISQALREFEILVGPNASGKSTFIDTIVLVSDFMREGLDRAILFSNGSSGGRAGKLDEIIFGGGTDHFELAFEMTIPDELVHPRRIDTTEYVFDIARYELAVGKTDRGELDIKREALWLIDSRLRDRQRAMPEVNALSNSFPVTPASPPTILHDAVVSVQASDISVRQGADYWQPVAIQSSRNRGSAVYFAETGRQGSAYVTETGEQGVPYRVGVRRSVFAGLPEDPENYPIAIWVRDLLRDDIRVLALNSAAMRRPSSPSASREFDVAGANLPLVLENLQQQDPTSYRDWIAHIQTILPDIKKIDVHERPEDRSRYLTVTYNNVPAPVPSWLVSDGTLRVFALTLLAYLPEQPRIYLIEEPENGIHPRAIEGVYQSLSSVYRGQVLVATHSPIFLSLAEPNQLLCFARTTSGAVDIVSGNQHPALKHWRGQIDLSTLYAAGVLG